jgi:hypothetical protein
MNCRPRQLLPDEVVAYAAARWAAGEPQQAIAWEMGLKPAFLSLEINRFLRTYLPAMPPIARRERFRMLAIALTNFRHRAESQTVQRIASECLVAKAPH